MLNTLKLNHWKQQNKILFETLEKTEIQSRKDVKWEPYDDDESRNT